MIEMTIEGIRVNLANYQRVVILKEKDASRYLPIWIGPAEADAIAVRLQEVSVARPLTHDLLRDLLEKLGARVDCVVVNDLADDTFYARIMISVSNGEQIEIDSRPSDAIALAVRTQVPIYAEDTVLDKAGVLLDKDGQPLEGQQLPGKETKVGEEEIQRMSAFKDFIEGLDLDDFDKRKS
ncbi:MAG: bifunctional nuclease family protein [Chloroflexi bacterium]|nr:bifunctional nuclease family protein [Chloroflexota bacterium]